MIGNHRARFFFYGFNILFPLLCGLYLYLTLRSDAYITLFISRFVSLPQFPYAFFSCGAIDFLRNFASDMLWAYSLGYAVVLVVGHSRNNLLFSLSLCMGFEVLVEVLQKTGVFHGTFDFLDILFEALSISLALFLINMYEEAQNEKSSKST